MTFQSISQAARSRDFSRTRKRGNETRRISRATDVVLNTIALTIPMLLFCIALLFLVFHHRVHRHSLPSDSLTLQDPGGEQGYYHVKISSTYLIFVASWSSTLAPLLAACITTLWSFPVAADMMKASTTEIRDRLPTPYQLALTLLMLESGGWISLWQWLKYLWCWREARKSQGRALLSVGSVLLIAQLLG